MAGVAPDTGADEVRVPWYRRENGNLASSAQRAQHALGGGGHTHQDQKDDLVRVELCVEGAVEPGQQHGRGDRVLEVPSRRCQPWWCLHRLSGGASPTPARSQSP